MDNEQKKQANLRVLQRVHSSITDIIGTATHVVLYQFNANGQKKWEKSNVEGSLFIVKHSISSSTNASNLCSLVILNRAGVENTFVRITPTFQMQLKDPYLIFRDPNNYDGDDNDSVRGIWFHDDHERAMISAMLERVMRFTVERAKKDATASSAASNTKPDASSSSSDNKPSSSTPMKNDYCTKTPTKSSVSNVASTDASKALLSPMQLLGLSPPPSSREQTSSSASPQISQSSSVSNNIPTVHDYGSEEPLDKKNLQLALLSLIQDDRFLDLIHAQYLKVANARKTKENSGK